MKKVIITGCSGQAGSYFVEYLLKNTTYEIYGLARRLSVKNHKNMSTFEDDDRFHLMSADLNDEHSIYRAIETVKPDYFINCAAMSYVAESWISPANTFIVDAVAIVHILEAIRKLVPYCRFINFGSSEEFGDVVYSPQDENHPPRARSVYGAAKIAARQIIKVYRESYNLYALQAWNFNYESKRRGEEFVTRKITKGIARIYHAIKKNQLFEPIKLGGYDSVRDWSHAEDIVDGVWKMINQEKPYYIGHNIEQANIFNERYKDWEPKEYVFSSNECHSVREFIEIATEIAGFKGWWSGQDMNEKYYIYDIDQAKCIIEISKDFFRLADVEKLWGNSQKARQELNWKPKYSFKGLVQEMVENDINNV